jgi:hypothetical protein
MGFSRGGGAAHWSAQKRFLAMHGPTSGQQFAGHIAFYPTCNRFFAGWLDVVDKPIRVFIHAAVMREAVANCPQWAACGTDRQSRHVSFGGAERRASASDSEQSRFMSTRPRNA